MNGLSREAELFYLITKMGELILKNGGEIYRADASMRYAAAAYGLSDFHSYVVANGIFSSYCSRGEHYSCRVMNVPFAPTVLCRIEALNDLSRSIAAGSCTPEEMRSRLTEIEEMQTPNEGMQLLASAVGAGCFSMLFRADLAEALCAFTAGFLLQFVSIFGLSRMQLPKLMKNIGAAATATAVCCILYHFGFGENLDLMLIGPVFVLTPGVPITIAIRNFMENDYLSGLLRMMDAILVAGGTAVGVGVTMQIMNLLFGGLL